MSKWARIFTDLDRAGLRNHLWHLLAGVVGLLVISLLAGFILGVLSMTFFGTDLMLGYLLGGSIGYIFIQGSVLALAYEARKEWKEGFGKDVEAAPTDDSISGPFWALGYVVALVVIYAIFLHSLVTYFPMLDVFIGVQSPGLLSIAAFVVDQALRGVLFDLMEVYKFGTTELEFRGGLNLFATSVFLFRFSVSLSVGATLLFAYRWYERKLSKSAKSRQLATPI